MIFSFETPERTVFDESGLSYLDSGRDICTDIQSGGTSCLQLKSEPLGPSSPESTSELLTGPEDCAGCGRLIQVSYCYYHFKKKKKKQTILYNFL